jgi:hypothetical protein
MVTDSGECLKHIYAVILSNIYVFLMKFLKKRNKPTSEETRGCPLEDEAEAVEVLVEAMVVVEEKVEAGEKVEVEEKVAVVGVDIKYYL